MDTVTRIPLPIYEIMRALEDKLEDSLSISSYEPLVSADDIDPDFLKFIHVMAMTKFAKENKVVAEALAEACKDYISFAPSLDHCPILAKDFPNEELTRRLYDVFPLPDKLRLLLEDEIDSAIEENIDLSLSDIVDATRSNDLHMVDDLILLDKVMTKVDKEYLAGL